MTKHRMMKLGGRCTVQKISVECEFGGHSPLDAHAKNAALGYDAGEISTGCLVPLQFPDIHLFVLWVFSDTLNFKLSVAKIDTLKSP